MHFPRNPGEAFHGVRQPPTPQSPVSPLAAPGGKEGKAFCSAQHPTQGGTRGDTSAHTPGGHRAPSQGTAPASDPEGSEGDGGDPRRLPVPGLRSHSSGHSLAMQSVFKYAPHLLNRKIPTTSAVPFLENYFGRYDSTSKREKEHFPALPQAAFNQKLSHM